MTIEKHLKSRILIVDDEPSVRNLLGEVLGEMYSCTTAESAEEALSCLERETFDLITSDINMDGMSGIELIARTSKLSPDTAVIMISGNQTIDSPIEAMREGAFDYIKKPFDIDQIEIAVSRAIAHSRLLVSKRMHENHLEQLVDERTTKLNYLAYHDTLTGLQNRRGFEDRLFNELQRKPEKNQVAVLFVSLDRFNGLRDTLGHSLGDRLLKEVAGRLDRVAKKCSTVARFEGGEFAVLMNDARSEELGRFAADVFDVFMSPFNVGEYEVFILASIGISLSPGDGIDAQTLLKNAGAALSHARKEGGNNYQFHSPDIQAAALSRLALENDLCRALERSEFELHYQPKIEMSTGRVTGMEALIRWNHPTRGLVPPQDFIALAEETGLIISISEWVLLTACAQSKIWHDKGFDLHLAVNLSPRQLQQRDLAETIINIVSQTGFDPGFLNLEVTESSIMNNTESAIAILRKLRNTRIKISMDDFGTGCSSLSHLKHLPIDVLKIDKSFVDDVTSNSDDAALVTAIVTLAHNLNLRVVAEGVETDDQLRFLDGLKCDEWQGYLFSKPVSAKAFESLLAEL